MLCEPLLKEVLCVCFRLNENKTQCQPRWLCHLVRNSPNTEKYRTEKYNYVMALLSLCACARSATHDMIKRHTTCAYENTSRPSTHGLFHMKRMHHELLRQSQNQHIRLARSTIRI